VVEEFAKQEKPESSEKLLLALLITEASKNDYTDFSFFSVFLICVIVT
jgi:hypothetical protein